jgi:hypothetical protein
MTENATALTLDVTLGSAVFSASGGSEHVLRAFADFQSLVALPLTGLETPASTGAKESIDEEPPVPSAQAEDSAAVVSERIPLPVFLSSKAIKGNSVIALGLAVWAKRYDNTAEVDSETIKNYWRKSPHKVPANIPRDLSNATGEGWFEKEGKAYFVTGHGERYFDSLPESEK